MQKVHITGVIFLKKYLLFTAGTISLLLGAAGLFLPLLPTTPFLLLSAGCYLRSSERFYWWITTNRVFGTYIKNYLDYHAISVKSKIITIVFLWIVICISIFLVNALWIRLLLAAVAVAVTIHIIMIPVLREESMLKKNDDNPGEDDLQGGV